ncbi:hypothetical protein UFOVP1204_1, partial [uncultured Caudovirales phage]
SAPAKPDDSRPQDKAARAVTSAVANMAASALLGPFGLPANLASLAFTGKSLGAHVSDYLDPHAADPSQMRDEPSPGGEPSQRRIPMAAADETSTLNTGGTPVSIGKLWARSFVGPVGDLTKYALGPQQTMYDTVSGRMAA